jgi:four helix bundle protein
LAGAFIVHFVVHFIENSAIRMLAHEKLQVYRKAVKFAAQAFGFCSGWDKRHALVDHLCRASESIVVNLAEAARLQGSCRRLTTVDYAIGSSLECAACFDLAAIKRLLTTAQSYHEKQACVRSRKC